MLVGVVGVVGDMLVWRVWRVLVGVVRELVSVGLGCV